MMQIARSYFLFFSSFQLCLRDIPKKMMFVRERILLTHEYGAVESYTQAVRGFVLYRRNDTTPWSHLNHFHRVT